MGIITKRELNQQTAKVLEAASTGEAITITERGVPRWRIERIDGSTDPLELLAARGMLRRPRTDPAPWTEWPSQEHSYTVEEIVSLVAESREDR